MDNKTLKTKELKHAYTQPFYDIMSGVYIRRHFSAGTIYHVGKADNYSFHEYVRYTTNLDSLGKHTINTIYYDFGIFTRLLDYNFKHDEIHEYVTDIIPIYFNDNSLTRIYSYNLKTLGQTEIPLITLPYNA